MLAASLALVALAMPLPHVFHTHTLPESRIALTLRNDGRLFRDLSIDGRTYTVLPGHSLQVLAPAGTRILSGDALGGRHRGDLVLEVTPANRGLVKLD